MLSSMLDTDKSDSQILDGLRRAGEERSISKIARELGIPRQALYDYSSKGYLGRESRKKLAQWLSTNRYMETSKPVPRKDPLSHAVAQELRGLADMLDSHVLEPGVKALRFRDAITSYFRTLEQYTMALEKTE